LALTTLFGTAQLALQDALARGLDRSGPTPKAPNFAIVSLRRERFLADNPGALADERKRFRHDLDAAVKSFLVANGWRIGGTGTMHINTLLRAHSRGFVAVKDGARLVSREHIALVFEDLTLTARLLGRNPTTLNGEPLGADEVTMHDGDTIACGHVRVTVRGLS
jgi:hypothetical protein